MSVRGELDKVHELKQLINLKMRQLFEKNLLRDGIGVTAIRYDRDIVKSSKRGDSLEVSVIECMMLEVAINDLKFELEDQKKKCIGIINQLDDDLEKRVLYLRYIEDESNAHIAEIIKKSRVTVWRIEKKAIKYLEMKQRM